MQSMRCITPSVSARAPRMSWQPPFWRDGRPVAPGALLHVQRSASDRAAWARKQP